MLKNWVICRRPQFINYPKLQRYTQIYRSAKGYKSHTGYNHVLKYKNLNAKVNTSIIIEMSTKTRLSR